VQDLPNRYNKFIAPFPSGVVPLVLVTPFGQNYDDSFAISLTKDATSDGFYVNTHRIDGVGWGQELGFTFLELDPKATSPFPGWTGFVWGSLQVLNALLCYRILSTLVAAGPQRSALPLDPNRVFDLAKGRHAVRTGHAERRRGAAGHPQIGERGRERESDR
jgi:hypothetical protein